MSLANITPDQYRAGYARNAAQLQRMADKATATGKKVNGYTADQLTQHAADFRRFAAFTDAELSAHVAGILVGIRERANVTR